MKNIVFVFMNIVFVVFVVMCGSVCVCVLNVVCVSRISILESSVGFLLHSFFNLLGLFYVRLY